MGRSDSISIPRKIAKRYKVVASCVVIRRGQLLLVRQGRGHQRGNWNLPGGKMDVGETVLEAAMRETHEETGLRVRAVGLSGPHVYRSKRKRQTLELCIHAKVDRGSIECDGDEIMDVRWFNIAKAAKMNDDRFAKPHVMRPTLDLLLEQTAPPLRIRDFAKLDLADLARAG